MGKGIPKKKKGELVPGTLILCDSGMVIAYYEHRTDIIANGENEKDARKNLRKLYDLAVNHEKENGEEPKDDDPLPLPGNFDTKKFVEKF